MNKLVFGVVWFIVFYFVGCMLAGGIAGGIAGAQHPESTVAAQRAGAAAGAKAVVEYRLYILAGAAALSAVGSATGVLPGTRRRAKPDPFAAWQHSAYSEDQYA